MPTVQVDLLEQDVLGVLNLVRSTKNIFAPINRVPPEVLFLIADYCDTEDTGKDIIALTHVCRNWREIFISHASLWTKLDCILVSKTRAYLERSKASPLWIRLEPWFFDDAFLLTVPHLDRLERIFLSGPADSILRGVQHLDSPSPLLKTFSIFVTYGGHFILQDSIFGGDLSSLRELCLDTVITDLAWKNMPNLWRSELCNVPADKISLTQLLNFFEGAPLLRDILIEEAFPDSSDVPSVGNHRQSEVPWSLRHRLNVRSRMYPLHSQIFSFPGRTYNSVLVISFSGSIRWVLLSLYFSSACDLS